MKPTTRLRQLLAVPGTLQIPGAYDGASARVVHALGHGAVYLTGFGMEASILGMPDIGLASQAEIVTHAGNIANAVPIPVIASGGVGTLDHMVEGVTEGHASAVLAASIFHFGTYSIQETKEFMAAAGVAVRMDH